MSRVLGMSSQVKIRAESVLMVLLLAVMPGHAMASDYSGLLDFVFTVGFAFLGVMGVVISCFYLLPGLLLNVILLISYMIYSIQFLIVRNEEVGVFYLLPLMLNLLGFVVLVVNKLKSSSKGR